tara:strand:+ start:352 stop:501 length:150 start_codon:yes stop_codon:yes gene_type:complete
MVGRRMLLDNRARNSSAIIKMKKFLNPGIATNNPAARPAHVVAVVSKTV